MLKTPDEVLAQIDALLETYTDAETVAILNQRGLHTGAGKPFTMSSLRWVQYARGAKSHRQHLWAAGLLTVREVASKLSLFPPHFRNDLQPADYLGAMSGGNSSGRW